MERRPEAKHLEPDFVDAHQQGGAAAAPLKGAQCFDTDTPADESGDKQTLGCARVEREGVIRQCVSVCACVHYGHCFLFASFRLFFLATRIFFSLFV